MSPTVCPHCHHDLSSLQGFLPETCPECGASLGEPAETAPRSRRVRRHFLRLDASSLVCKNCGTIDAQTIHRNYVSSLRHLLPHWVVRVLGIAGGNGKLCKVCHQLDLVPAGSEEGQQTLQRHHPDAQVIGSLGRRRRMLGWVLGISTLFGVMGVVTWTVVFPKLSMWLNGGDDTTVITRQQAVTDCQTFVRQSEQFPPGATFDSDHDLHVSSTEAQWLVDGEITRINPGAARTRLFYTCVMQYVNKQAEVRQLEIR